MARPRKCKRVCRLPAVRRFGPLEGGGSGPEVAMTVEEFETIRLLDGEGLSQEACAAQMGVARTTVQGLYEGARKKLARALVEGGTLAIGGGEYALCDGRSGACPRRLCQQARAETDHRMQEGKSMKIAVTFENGQVFQHFGHTEHFKIYEAQDGKLLSSQIVDAAGSGHGALAGFLRERGVEALICGNIGPGARMALAQAGIALYGGVTGDVDQAAAALAAGTLEYNPGASCQHAHEHHHGDCGSHDEHHHGDCGGHGEHHHGDCGGHGEHHHGDCGGGCGAHHHGAQDCHCGGAQ